MCNAHVSFPVLSCDSPLSDSDWGESSFKLTLSHFAYVYAACRSLFFQDHTASVGRSVDRSAARSVGESVGESVGRSAGRSAGQPVGRLAGRSVGRSVGGSVAATVAPSILRSVGRSVGRVAGRSAGRSIGENRRRGAEEDATHAAATGHGHMCIKF